MKYTYHYFAEYVDKSNRRIWLDGISILNRRIKTYKDYVVLKGDILNKMNINILPNDLMIKSLTPLD